MPDEIAPPTHVVFWMWNHEWNMRENKRDTCLVGGRRGDGHQLGGKMRCMTMNRDENGSDTDGYH
jgi:hypothetical protein